LHSASISPNFGRGNYGIFCESLRWSTEIKGRRLYLPVLHTQSVP
jgi:hypothetical protein